jgi:hypothetical protein
MRPSKLGPVIGVLLALVIAGLVGAAFLLIGNGDSRGVVVRDDSTPAGYQALEYRGVRVDIPQDWVRVEDSDCEFEFERWAPPGSPTCEPDITSVAFYGRATFDPELGPGLQRVKEPEKAWAGYVIVGDWAVYVSGPERAAAAAMLASARVTDVNRPVG